MMSCLDCSGNISALRLAKLMRSSELSGMYDQRKAETSHAKPHSAHWSVPELMSLIQRPEEVSQCGEEKVSEEDKLDCYCVNYGVYTVSVKTVQVFGGFA